jgi:hypothetical protein
MQRGRTLGVVFALAVSLAACSARRDNVGALTQALRQQYPGVQVHVQLANAGRKLWIRADSGAWRNYRLSSSELQARAAPIARFALQHYMGARSIDSVTVEFVQETSGALLWKSWSSQVFTSAAAADR